MGPVVDRGRAGAPRLPGWAGWLAAAGVALALPWAVDDFFRQLLVFLCISIILTSSLDILVGQAGLLVLAQAGFLGVGAYASAILTTFHHQPFLVGVLAAMGASAVAGVVIGYPSRRLRGPYYVVTTFVFGIVLTILFTNLVGLTRGPMGIPGIPPAAVTVPGLGPYRFTTQASYYYLTLAAAAAITLLRARLLRSRMGRALAAIRENEDLAISVGIPTDRAKVLAFLISAPFAGLAGALYAHYLAFVGPTGFTFQESFEIFVMDLVGGPGTLAGPIVGSVLLSAVKEGGRSLSPAIGEIVFGAFLLGTIVFFPRGILGHLRPRAAAGDSTTPGPRRLDVSPARTPEPVSRGEGVTLRVDSLTKVFGGFRAVSDLTFEVGPGELLALVGPNGAGKTTTLNLVTGYLPVSGGRVWCGGVDVTRLPPHARARIGIVRTFQLTSVFSKLSVEENVRTGCYLWEVRPGGRDTLDRRVEEVLHHLGLWESRGKAAEDLPYGDGRLLEIAIALGAGPRVLLLDEPLAGMTMGEAERTMRVVRDLASRGMTIVLVEHNMRAVMRHADRIVVVHHGEKLAEGSPSSIATHPEVIRAYLGGGAHATA